jgi:hypothetical protein
MSGSLTWRTYTGDNGTGYSVFRDESNAESITSTSGAATLLSALVPGNPGLSQLIRPRYVNAQLSTNAAIRKRFIVGTIAIFGAIAAGTTITENTTPALVWNVTGKVGERQRIPTAVDTGQTDGDAS